jgi:hypothetical protein
MEKSAHVPEPQVRPLADQVEVEVGEGGGEGVRVGLLDDGPVRLGHAQAVAEGADTHDSGVSAEGLRHQYTEILTEIRHYSNLRFAIFTLFFAVSGALLSAAFGFFEIKGSVTARQVQSFMRPGGLLVTLLFFLYELRIQALINHGFRTGSALETKLAYNYLSSRPPWRWYRSHNATRAFFAALLGLWLWLLLVSPG